MLPPHRHNLRIYYEDTDAAGIVYYANYLKFAERARTEMMREAGFENRRLFEETGIAFAVRRCEVDYLAPARLDDLVEVESRLVGTRRASFAIEQIVRRDGRDLARLMVTLVCISREGRAVGLPEPLRAVIATQNQEMEARE